VCVCVCWLVGLHFSTFRQKCCHHIMSGLHLPCYAVVLLVVLKRMFYGPFNVMENI